MAAFSAASFVVLARCGAGCRIGSAANPVLLVSLAGTAVGSLLTGLAGGLSLLLVGRIIDGASGASVAGGPGRGRRSVPSGRAVRACSGCWARPSAWGSSPARPSVRWRRSADPGCPFSWLRAWPPSTPLSPCAGCRRPGRRGRSGPPPGALAALRPTGRGVAPLLAGRLLRHGGVQRLRGHVRPLRPAASRPRDRLRRRRIHRRGRRDRRGAGRPGPPWWPAWRASGPPSWAGLAANAAGLAVLAGARFVVRGRSGAPPPDRGAGTGPDHHGDAWWPGGPDPGRRGEVLGAQQSAGGLARVVGPALGWRPARRGCLRRCLICSGCRDRAGRRLGRW